MTDRILEIAEEGGALSLDLGRLRLKRDGTTLAEVPVTELAAVILAHPRITVTHPALAALASAGVIVVVADEKRLPAGMLMPLQTSSIPARRMSAQIALSLPRAKQLWKTVVKAKITAQAAHLIALDGAPCGLSGLVGKVRSGDLENIEAQAARRYWPLLFGPDFRRLREGPGPNPYLNYGYSVLRAIVARSICAAGLHPCLGIQHHHRGNPFCLADDLMEPFRPLVDAAVVERTGRDSRAGGAILDREDRAALVGALQARYDVEGERRTLPDAIRRMVGGFARSVEDSTRPFTVPVVG